jgi:hypothetical protein
MGEWSKGETIYALEKLPKRWPEPPQCRNDLRLRLESGRQRQLSQNAYLDLALSFGKRGAKPMKAPDHNMVGSAVLKPEPAVLQQTEGVQRQDHVQTAGLP